MASRTTSCLYAMTLPLLLAAAGCKLIDKERTASSLDDFAYKATAENFVILAGNDGSHLSAPQPDGTFKSMKLGGVPTDIQTWWELICPGRPYQEIIQDGVSSRTPVRCTGSVLGNYEVVYANKFDTSADDLNRAMNYVGERLTAESTLIFVYSGHGEQNGNLFITPKPSWPWAPFQDTLTAAATRANKRAARFYFFNDACFSGQLVTGKDAAVDTGETSESLEDGQILNPAVADGYSGRDLDETRLVMDEARLGGTDLPGMNAGMNTGMSLADPSSPYAGPYNNPSFSGGGAVLSATTTLANSMAPLTTPTVIAAPSSSGTLSAPQTGQANSQDGTGLTRHPVFDQAVIFSSANQGQLAGDEGANKGGTFTWRLKKTIEHYRAQYYQGNQTTNPSLQRVFNAVTRYVQASARSKGRAQVPQYRVTPDCMLQEKFFLTGAERTACLAPSATNQQPSSPSPGQRPTTAP